MMQPFQHHQLIKLQEVKVASTIFRTYVLSACLQITRLRNFANNQDAATDDSAL